MPPRLPQQVWRVEYVERRIDPYRRYRLNGTSESELW
jgi:hypothetical protein